MINRNFYKQVNFWFGILLIALETQVINKVIYGNFISKNWASSAENILDLLLLISGILLIFKSTLLPLNCQIKCNTTLKNIS
ncbi:hypothetical protein ADT67_11100 [Levilactobacillus brevis]|nr:hypothetical protein ADT67_11100 [Levilactobacillus brevis]